MFFQLHVDPTERKIEQEGKEKEFKRTFNLFLPFSFIFLLIGDKIYVI